MQFKTVHLEAHKRLELSILSDVHLEDPACQVGELEAWRDWVSAKRHRHFIALGDYFDTATRTSVGSPFGQRMGLADAQSWMASFLAPVASRCLIMIPGNHERRVSKDANTCPARTLAEALSIPYDSSVVALNLKVGRVSYKVHGVHGWGGGRMPGGKLNKLVSLSDVCSADLHMMGHTHHPMSTKDMKGGKLRTYVMAGSFLGPAKYSQRAGYSPSAILQPVIHLDGERKAIKVTL